MRLLWEQFLRFFEIAPREGTLLRLTHATQNVEAHTVEVVEA